MAMNVFLCRSINPGGDVCFFIAEAYCNLLATAEQGTRTQEIRPPTAISHFSYVNLRERMSFAHHTKNRRPSWLLAVRSFGIGTSENQKNQKYQKNSGIC